MSATISARRRRGCADPAFVDVVPCASAWPRTATTTCRCSSRPGRLLDLSRAAERWPACATPSAILRRGKAVTCGVSPRARRCSTGCVWRSAAAGTKEGCAEGDCGACTVVLGRLRDGRLVYEPVNACILLLGQADGARCHRRGSRRRTAAASGAGRRWCDHHGSQCGFCTPGIVMSLVRALPRERRGRSTREAGRPTRSPAISAAAPATGRSSTRRSTACAAPRRDDAFASRRKRDRCGAGRACGRRGPLRRHDGRFFAAPASEDVAGRSTSSIPTPRCVAGATDVGLWITKAMMRARAASSGLGRVTGLDAHRGRSRRRARPSAPAPPTPSAIAALAATRSRSRRAHAPLRLGCRSAPPARSAATSPTARRSATSRRR